MIASRTFLYVVLAVFWLAVGCAQAPLDYPRTASWAIAHPEQTRLGQEFAAPLASHPAQSGFHLLRNGPDALVTRLTLIDAAERTLDVQCFILEDDAVGNLLLDRLLAAAERGVRVRLLIDDWYMAGQDQRLAVVGTQGGLEVRIFNPAGSPRWSTLTRPLHYLFGPHRVLQRMHNKALVVDNTIAIVGGRNLTDRYFSASSDYNYGDIDTLAVGPVAGQVSAGFDEFWNDRLAVPIEAFEPAEHTAGRLPEARRKLEASRVATLSSPYASFLRGYDPAKQADIGQLPLIWAECEAIQDRPGKVLASIKQKPSDYMVFALAEILADARSEVLAISPYFVPGSSGLAHCRELRDRGVEVKVLTNSLASTDEVAPHAAYEKYRADLLRIGVQLYELRPRPDRRGQDKRDHQYNPASDELHAKCLVVDRSVAFVGSFNLDSRSVEMDTQNGIVIRSQEFAARLTADFAKRTSAGYAYRVRFVGSLRGTDDTRIVWTSEVNSEPMVYSDEPMSGPGRRFKAWILSWLAPESWM